MIEVLISTMDRKDPKELMLKEKNIEGNVLIVNQSEKRVQQFNENGIRMLSYQEKGLSKSRNRAIKNAIGDICLIADDDIQYKKGIFQEIQKVFLNHPDFDVLTFKYDNKKSKYGKLPFNHNYRTIRRVSSIEIAFRRDQVINKSIRFNELFGLGSRYISGEENIFLKDCLDKGLKIKYIPLSIAYHLHDESTGRIWSRGLFFSKGALFFELYGKFSYIYDLGFCIKKYFEYKEQVSFIHSLKYIFEGAKDYIKIMKEKNDHLNKNNLA